MVAVPNFFKKIKLPHLPKPSAEGKVGNLCRNYISPRSFVWTLGLLTVGSVFSIHQIHPVFTTVSDEQSIQHDAGDKSSFSGKIMAELDISSPEEDVPIQYGIEGMSPAPLRSGDIDLKGQAMTGGHTDIQTVPETSTTAEVPKTIGPNPELIEGLFEDTPFGKAPIRREADGKTIFSEYAVPFSARETTRGIIALVMVDYGLSDSVGKSALEQLPPYVSFVVSPYARDIQGKISLARSNNSHEIWMDAPIQTKNFGYDDTGPLTLLSGLNNDQNYSRLLRIFSLGYGYAGIAFTNAPEFSGADDGLENIFSILEKRGVGLVTADPQDNASSVLAERHKSLPFVKNGMWINADSGTLNVKSQLANLEKIAADKNVAIAFIRPQPNLFSVISEWEKSLSAQSIQLAPLSAVIEHSH